MIRLWLFYVTISNITKELSKVSSSRSLKIESSASHNSAYNLDSAYNLTSYSWVRHICKISQ